MIIGDVYFIVFHGFYFMMLPYVFFFHDILNALVTLVVLLLGCKRVRVVKPLTFRTFSERSAGYCQALLPGGSLSPIRRATNPLMATLGGVVGPVATYAQCSANAQ